MIFLWMDEGYEGNVWKCGECFLILVVKVLCKQLSDFRRHSSFGSYVFSVPNGLRGQACVFCTLSTWTISRWDQTHFRGRWIGQGRDAFFVHFEGKVSIPWSFQMAEILRTIWEVVGFRQNLWIFVPPSVFVAALHTFLTSGKRISTPQQKTCTLPKFNNKRPWK